MTYVKLEDVLNSVISVRAANAGNFERSGAVWEAYDKAVLDCHEALRSLPTDDGVTDKERREIVAWLRAEANERGKRDRNDYRNTAFVKSKAEQIILVLASKIERLEHK